MLISFVKFQIRLINFDGMSKRPAIIFNFELRKVVYNTVKVT